MDRLTYLETAMKKIAVAAGLPEAASPEQIEERVLLIKTELQTVLAEQKENSP